MRVVLTFDRHEWDDFLKAWQEPAVRRTLNAAASAFGRAAKPAIQSEIPQARPGNKYAVRGTLRQAVKARRIKPALGVGVVIGPMGKNVFYRGWVAGGTKPHRIRFPDEVRKGVAKSRGSIRHPGAKPNDFIGRASGRAERDGFAKAEQVILDGLEGKRISEGIDT